MNPALLLAAVIFPTSFGVPWAAWHDVRVFGFAPPPAPLFVRVPLTGVDTGDAGVFSAVRIVDDEGTEIPYALDPDRIPLLASAKVLPQSDPGFVRGSYSQTVLDFGTDPAQHEAVRIDTSRGDFLLRASVETSDDRTTWRLARDDATIYRIGTVADVGAGPAANPVYLTVSYPPSHARWLRLRVYDPTTAFDFRSVRLETGRAPAQAFDPVAEAPFPEGVSGASTQQVTFDLGSPTDLSPHFGEIDGLRLSGGNAEYFRSVSVETSADGTAWSTVASEVPINRTASQRYAEIALERTFARKVRVTLDNHSDAAMPHVAVTLLSVPRDLVFQAQPGRRYALLSGNITANETPPSYELSQLLAHRDWHADLTAFPAIRNVNAAYRDQRPLTERVPWLVDLGFVLASLVVGAIALQTIRGTLKN